jgi:hypothetical protein
MIADLDKTIRQLLLDELSIKNGEIEISFDQPKREWSARLGNTPTINLFLYDVRENPHLRTHQWEAPTNGRNGKPLDPKLVHQKRTPMRVDCFYMLTTWANDSGDEHRLLTDCMIALFRHPLLDEARLEGRLQNPTYDVRTRLASHDVLTNPAEVWGALDNEMRPSVSYVVTLTLDPWSTISGPPVRTFSLSAGQEGNPSELAQRPLTPDPQQSTLTFIGGSVRNRESDGPPAAGLEVSIKDTGLYTRTDEQGRFRFGGLLPNDYTLVVQPPKGRQKTKAISVPAKTGEDYDLEI